MLKNNIREFLHYFLDGGYPQFLIVGAQKAGTTSLHNYLCKHPDLVGATEKEVAYFNNDYKYELGDEWYKSRFKNVKNILKKNIFFESTPEYLYSSKALSRIYNFNPKIKLIILLREPVSRAYSAWNMFRDFKEGGKSLPQSIILSHKYDSQNRIYSELYLNRLEFPSFEEVVEIELNRINTASEILEPSFIRRGIYYNQIKNILAKFPKENVLILGYKDLFGIKKMETLKNIVGFLEIAEFNWNNLKEEKMHNKRAYNSEINPITFQKLQSFYDKHNIKLFKFLNVNNINW